MEVVGLCDVSANMLFSVATTHGYLSIVAVLSALYPIVTVALAAVILKPLPPGLARMGSAGKRTNS